MPGKVTLNIGGGLGWLGSASQVGGHPGPPGSHRIVGEAKRAEERTLVDRARTPWAAGRTDTWPLLTEQCRCSFGSGKVWMQMMSRWPG